MAKYTSRIKPKRIPHRTITHNPFLNPRPTTGGGNSKPSTPATKKQIDSFEAEYQKFINELKAKKEAEKAKAEETKVEEPVVEQTESPVYPDDGETEGETTPVEVVETKPKKTRKKKEVVEEETDISEEPVNEVPEQTETTEA